MTAPFKFKKEAESDGYTVHCRECDREIGYVAERPRVPSGYTGRWVGNGFSFSTRRQAGATFYSNHLCGGLH